MEVATMIAKLLLGLGIGIFGSAEYPSTHVDCIELSHIFDMKGRIIYDQMIAWEWNPTNGKFQVRGWCLCNEDYPITFDGITKFENKDYRLHSPLFRESWSILDPERENKKVWPESMRYALPMKQPWWKGLKRVDNQTTDE
jgi:hypothetical protein